MTAISVVVTTYNRAALLRRTLEQLTTQAFEAGDEVIVVDNSSTDETPRLLAAAREWFRVPFQVLVESTPGKTPALNRGLAAAKGDVFALTDDDVLVDMEWLATIRSIFRDPSLALAGGRVDPLWETSPPGWLKIDETKSYDTMTSPLALVHYGEAQPLGARTAVGANMAVRRQAHDSIGGFAPHLGRRRGTLLCGEDHDFCQRVAAAGYRCEYRPELRVRHWVPAARTTLRYYLRWFFWSGITNAVLDADTASGDARSAGRHFVRRAVACTARAAVSLLQRRWSDAARHVMEAAFAAGYLRQTAKNWSRRTVAKPAMAGRGVE
jgi:glucosyl-dolichyl phosphate glucuronosyltransferase